jgi:hypothetical protein
MRTLLIVMLSALAPAACSPETPGEAASSADAANSSDAVDCMPAVHPGTVTFIDGDTGAVVAVTPIAELPESFRYVTTPAGRVPVVKAVKTTTRDGVVEINEYGPCGQWLQGILGATI